MIESFKFWLEQIDQKQKQDLEKTLSRLPPHFRRLTDGFDFHFEDGNDLHGDDGHVGVVSTSPKKIIRVAAPWRYGREFTVLHEIGHLVWATFVKNTPQEEAWRQLAGKDYEEDFCMGFGSRYSQHPVTTYVKPGWTEFFDSLSGVKS